MILSLTAIGRPSKRTAGVLKQEREKLEGPETIVAAKTGRRGRVLLLLLRHH